MTFCIKGSIDSSLIFNRAIMDLDPCIRITIVQKVKKWYFYYVPLFEFIFLYIYYLDFFHQGIRRQLSICRRVSELIFLEFCSGNRIYMIHWKVQLSSWFGRPSDSKFSEALDWNSSSEVSIENFMWSKMLQKSLVSSVNHFCTPRTKNIAVRLCYLLTMYPRIIRWCSWN